MTQMSALGSSSEDKRDLEITRGVRHDIRLLYCRFGATGV